MRSAAAAKTLQDPWATASPLSWLSFRHGRHIITLLLLAPAVVFVGLCFVVPLARFCALAFTGDDGAQAAFETLLSSNAYRNVFFNTVQISFVVTLICVAFAFPVALTLAKLKGIWFNIVLYCVLFPFWVSLLVRTFSWMLLLERNGPVNQTLVALGVTEQPLRLLFNDFSVVVGMVHVLLPYAVLPLFARMRSIDRRLLMASDGLGASIFDTMRLVYLPLVLPGLLGAAAIVFLLALGFFVTPALLGGASSLTVATLISGFVFDRLAWSLAAAASLILLVFVLALLALSRRVVSFGEGMTMR